jgi:HEAT repeat protein
MIRGTGASQADEPEMARLIEQLGSEEFDVRQEAATALCGRGEATRAALAAGLSHLRWRVRRQCALLLAELSDGGWNEPLLRAAADPIVGVRCAALHALASRESEPAAARAALIGALLERALTDPSASVRRRALHGLGQQPRDARIIEALQSLAGHERDPRLLRLAQWALSQQERKSASSLPAPSEPKTPPLPNARDRLGLSPAEPLPPLGTLPDRALVALLGAQERHVRNEAYGVLFHRGQAVLDVLVQGMRDPSEWVRRACTSLMDHLADNRCVQPLFQALRDPDERVRRGALHSLTCDACKIAPLEGDPLPPLIERALADPKLRVRRVATEALANYIADARAVSALTTILREASDPILRARAERGLGAARSRSGS